MSRRTILSVLVLVTLGIVFSLPTQLKAADNEIIIYGFEKDLSGWEIPSWAREKDDHVANDIFVSDEVSSEGMSSMVILANFPGKDWTGAYVEKMMDVRDWSPFGVLSVDVYVPDEAPVGLAGQIILTTGEDWTWTEMNRSISLKPGEWTTISVNLRPGSLDWKFFPDESFRADIRKLGVRVESDRGPVYYGPAYVDNITLSE